MKQVLAVVILSLLPVVMIAQINATTEDGKQIQLNADGTWKYVVDQNSQAIFGAEDCSKLLEIKTDKMTQIVTVAIKDPLIVAKTNSESIAFYAAKRTEDKVMLVLGIRSENNCVDDNSKVIWLFRDGTKFDVDGGHKFNCDGEIYFVFDTEDDEMIAFANKEIDAVRAYTHKGSIDVEFNPESSRLWMQYLSCLLSAKMSE
ncbi:MAG: DUF3157 family protein [Bacteroidetes bacterium]|nr:DUF3157 family protein [Bacteroidota bacterium]